MTNEPAEQQETWRIAPERFPTADGDYVYLVVPIYKNGFAVGRQSVQMPEWLADRIISDHNSRAAMEQALRDCKTALNEAYIAFTEGVSNTRKLKMIMDAYNQAEQLLTPVPEGA